MTIDELRGWAAFMDKAVIASLVVTLLAVVALGLTTFLSLRFSGAVRAHDQAAFDRYKGVEGHSQQLEREVAAARQRVSTLEQEIATAHGQTTALEQQAAAARERAAALEQEAAAARERAAAFGQAAREANERAARADRESAAAASARERAGQPDAAEIQQRLAELAKRVREAASAPALVPVPAPAPAPSPIVASLGRYAGTRAAVFVLDPVTDAPAAGAAILADLGDAGWVAQSWKWTGVAGIFGVVVLVKEGSEPAINEAASELVEALRAAGFSTTKGDWPADWRRFRGTLDGPQTPAATDAPIRIVIGSKPR